MKERNIPVLNFPKKTPITLSGVDDPLLPKQIADELYSRHDIVEIAFFPPCRSWKGQYRVSFKNVKNSEFVNSMFDIFVILIFLYFFQFSLFLNHFFQMAN